MCVRWYSCAVLILIQLKLQSPSAAGRKVRNYVMMEDVCALAVWIVNVCGRQNRETSADITTNFNNKCVCVCLCVCGINNGKVQVFNLNFKYWSIELFIVYFSRCEIYIF